MASFGAQPFGKRHFCTLLRYFSLMCIQHIALKMPCCATKMAVSMRPELVLIGPKCGYQAMPTFDVRIFLHQHEAVRWAMLCFFMSSARLGGVE